MQLLSEVQSANDITVVGLLPPNLQNFVVYDTAIPAYNDKPEVALAFVKFLSEPNKKGFWKAAGFELMRSANQFALGQERTSRHHLDYVRFSPQSGHARVASM